MSALKDNSTRWGTNSSSQFTADDDVMVPNDTSSLSTSGFRNLNQRRHSTASTFGYMTDKYDNVSSTGDDFPHHDVEEFLHRMNDDFTQLVFPAIIILGCLFFIGVIGNSLVIYVYNRKLRRGTIRWFVQALAVFDLLSCLVAIPGEMVDMRNNYTFGSNPMCKILRTVGMFVTYASGMTLMVVAVERYKRICTPLKKQITSRGARMIVAVCTGLAAISAAPAAFIYGEQTTPTDNPEIFGSDCSTADAYRGTIVSLSFNTFQFLLFTVGALGLVVLYSLIGRQIWTHAHFRRVGFNSGGVNRRVSFMFTGSDGSSPTTDESIFTFSSKKNKAVDNELSNNSSSDTSSNNNNNTKSNVTSSPAAMLTQDKPGSDAEGYVSQNPAVLTTTSACQDKSTSLTPADLVTNACQDKADKSTSHNPVGLVANAVPNTKLSKRQKSVDFNNIKGRYRRRPSIHTSADIRRFLSRSDSVNSGTRQTTLMLFLITLVYLLSFLPYLVLIMLKVLDDESLSGGGDGWELAHNILLRSYFINSVSNPIIYSFCSRTFRKECSKVLHCVCCRNANDLGVSR